MKRINKNHLCYIGDRDRPSLVEHARRYITNGYSFESFCEQYMAFTAPYSFERTLLIKFYVHTIEFLKDEPV